MTRNFFIPFSNLKSVFFCAIMMLQGSNTKHQVKLPAQKINWANGTVKIKIFRLYIPLYKVIDSQKECFGSNSRDRVKF